MFVTITVSIFFIILNFFIIISIGLPFLIDLIIFLIFIFLFFKNKVLFHTYTILFLISIIFINIFILDKTIEKKQILNGHKKFIFKDKYKKNINALVPNIPGNLIALDTCTNNINNYKIKIDNQQFVTDEFGFRNTPNSITESNYILVGNSIIMGSRLSHNNILSEILNKNSKLKFSNIAIGGTGPKIYENNMLELLPILKNKQKFLVFYFEGNDFISKKNDNNFYWYGKKIPKYKYRLRFGYERIERNKDKILNKKFFDKNYFYQIVRPHSQRFYNKLLSRWTDSCLVEWKNIKSKKIGFLYKYYDLNEYKTHIIKNNDLIDRIEKVIFIPTKYSTYEKYFNNKLSKKNRENKIKFLRKEYQKLNIEVINLTEVFQNKSIEKINDNKLLFFQDDTHLNKIGNKILSNYLLKILFE